MNAECRGVRPLLSAYMDNDLTPDELRVLQAHVAGCQECAAVLRDYRHLRSAVRALPQPLPPAELRAAVFARATPAHRRRAAFAAFGQRGLSYAALAAAVVALLFTGALLLRGGAGQGLGTADTTPPSIVAVVPPPGTPNVGLTTPVRITFSEPMDQESVLAALSITADPPLTPEERQRLLRDVRWDGAALVIGEAGSFQPYTNYYITIDPSRVHDRANNALRVADTTITTFQTVDVAAATPTATAVVGAASAAPAPTATAQTPPATAPTQVPRPTEGPALPSAPPPTVAATAQTPPAPTRAPAPPPTATLALPTATLRPTQLPLTSTPAPSATARPTEAPTPTATPAKSPYVVGPSFAAAYDGDAALAERVGPPTANEAAVQGGYLAFERGWMLYRADTRTIYVLFNEDPQVWYAFADGWSEGMPPGGGPAEKAGLFKPARGFGKVWAENAEVQRRLGFALGANEVGGAIAVQPFERGLLIASDLGAPFTYVFYQNNLYERIAR